MTVNPEITEKDFLDIRVNQYLYAQLICEPGYLENLPPVKLPLKGLYVADISYYYPDDREIRKALNLPRNMVNLIFKAEQDAI